MWKVLLNGFPWFSWCHPLWSNSLSCLWDSQSKVTFPFSPQTSVGVVLREKPGCSRLRLVSSLYSVGHLFCLTWKVLLNGLVNMFFVQLWRLFEMPLERWNIALIVFFWLAEIRNWWEVPSIAHFCSLFRAAFGLTDFEIEVRTKICNYLFELRTAFFFPIVYW